MKHKYKLYDEKVRIIKTGETGIVVDAEGFYKGEPLYEVELDREIGPDEPLTVTCLESDIELV